MHGYRFATSWLDGIIHPAHSHRVGSETMLRWTRAFLAGCRDAVARAAQRIRGVTPEQWFLAGFALLFAVFFILLVVQPTAVGRGGR